MQTQTIQLRVSLSTQLQARLQAKASQIGLNMSSYVKNLIINDVKTIEYPVMLASKKTEAAYKSAITERSKAIDVDDVGSYLDNL